MKKTVVLFMVCLVIFTTTTALLSACSDIKSPDNYETYYNEQSNNSKIDDSSDQTNSKPVVEKVPIKIPETTIDESALTKRSVKLEVKYLSQNPELPCGCEITSLTTVLNFYGYDVSKTDMADNYLQKSDTGKDAWKYFIGNPREITSFGCYAQPITDAANKYLSGQESNHVAYNCSGMAFEDLLLEVEKGRPVVIWGTLNMAQPYYSYIWKLEDGSEFRWITPEHCLVLIGYDLDRGVAIMSDPMVGITEYPLNTVKAMYNVLHSQCVIIY